MRTLLKTVLLWGSFAALALAQQPLAPPSYFRDAPQGTPLGGAAPEVVIQPVQATEEITEPPAQPPPTPLQQAPPTQPTPLPNRQPGLFTLPVTSPPPTEPPTAPLSTPPLWAPAPAPPSASPEPPPQLAQAPRPAPIPQPSAAPPTSAAQNSAADDLLPPTVVEQFRVVWSHVSAVWNFVIVCGADGKPLVTVGTLIGGIVLMGVGYVVAGMISRWIGSRLLGRLGLHQSARAPLQSISYYVLLITFGMLTLNILNVPITVFSFLGGALAIGAGFGSQNIVNNFISGLILLAERPIRVGDIVEIDGRSGRVTEIGARSTRLVTMQNIEVVVPNSKILENQFTNWTLGDDRVCTGIKIGVAYGSPTRKVAALLEQAAAEHPSVLKSPEIEVLFEDFGADALIFEVRFWLQMLKNSRIELESDIRFRIDELFSQAGIVIAYPQRDVHLNVMRPLEVRLAADSPRDLRRAAA